MKCPCCLKHPLSPITLEDRLQVDACDQCGGYWLDPEKYDSWLEQREVTLPEKEPVAELEINDNSQVKICPNCGSILLKYRVGNGTKFFIDRCGSCHGVWFDCNEWEALKQRNFHDEINHIFSQSWQEKVRQQENAENLDRIYQKKFGRKDYEEAQKIWAWLRTRPEYQGLLAYLNDENPYQV